MLDDATALNLQPPTERAVMELLMGTCACKIVTYDESAGYVEVRIYGADGEWSADATWIEPGEAYPVRDIFNPALSVVHEGIDLGPHVTQRTAIQGAKTFGDAFDRISARIEECNGLVVQTVRRQVQV